MVGLDDPMGIFQSNDYDSIKLIAGLLMEKKKNKNIGMWGFLPIFTARIPPALTLPIPS